MHQDFSLTDNPFWSALQTSQRHFSIGTTMIKKFPTDILPFVGLAEQDASLLQYIVPYIGHNEEVYVKNGIGQILRGWEIINNLSCIQMVCTNLPDFSLDKNVTISRLGDKDFDELFSLVNLVQPGFIMKRTHLLGDYFGIRIDGKLVATAGERLKMTGFIELSAVCTLPEYTGKGYAQVLIRHVCENIFKKGEIPILHVLESNTRAIQLYELFNFRKKMDFPLLKLKWKG
jgi:GNAT superfamily N-acetyltransferase